MTSREMVDDDIDWGSYDPLGQLRDASLPQREVIREDFDTALAECGQGDGMG